MRQYVKTLIERKHLVRQGSEWVRFGYSESIMSQFDRWKLDIQQSKRSIHITSFRMYDFVEGLGDPAARECFPCHVGVVTYMFDDEAAKHGVVDQYVEAQPHQAKVYEQIQKEFFRKPRTGRVLCPKITPLVTFFQMDSDIEAIGSDIDCCDLPLPDMVYDYAVYDNVLHDTANPYKALRQVYRVLRPGGYLVLVEQLFGPITGKTYWRVTPSMLRKMLERFQEVYINTWGGPRAIMHMVGSGGGWGPLPNATLKEILEEYDPRWPLFVWAIARR